MKFPKTAARDVALCAFLNNAKFDLRLKKAPISLRRLYMPNVFKTMFRKPLYISLAFLGLLHSQSCWGLPAHPTGPFQNDGGWEFVTRSTTFSSCSEFAAAFSQWMQGPGIQATGGLTLSSNGPVNDWFWGYGAEYCDAYLNVVYPPFGVPGQIVAEASRIWACPQGETITNDVPPLCVIPKFYVLTAPSKAQCEREGNPCVLATGAKLQTDTDFVAPVSGLLTLRRTYNSLQGAAWSDNFSAFMSAESASNGVFPLASDRSKPYSSAQSACLQGWGDISASVWGGTISSASAVYLGGLSCQIQIGGKAVADFSIQEDNNLDYAPLVGPLTVQTVRLPNGHVYTFELVNGVWTETFSSVSVKLIDTGSRFLFLGDDDRFLSFGYDGRLNSITIPSGQGVNLNYAALKPIAGTVSTILLSTVVDTFGRTLTYSYDPSSLELTGFSDPAGNVFGYSLIDLWTPTANLATYTIGAVSYPVASGAAPQVRNYVFGESAYTSSVSLPAALTGIVDENGSRFATFSYDINGHVASTQHFGGVELTSFAYGADGSTTVVDALGGARSYQFAIVAGARRVTSVTGAKCSSCADADQKLRSYDAQGNLSSFTDWVGNLSCFAYDLTRNLEIARVEGFAPGSTCPSPLSTYVPAAGTAQRLIQAQWHPAFKLKTGETAPLKISTWVYNGQPDPTNGNTVASCAPSTALLPDGNPIAVLCKKVEQATTDATGGAGFSATATGAPRVWTYTYNQWGQKLTATGPRGNLATSDPNYAVDTTTYAYYAATVAGSYTMGDLSSVTDAAGHVTSFPLYDANGRVLESIDPNGTTATYTYAPRGWLLTRTVTPAGASTSQLTQYGYDGVGQLKSVTNPDGTQVLYAYDNAHRLTAVTDSAGDSINYTLDAMGNRTTEQVKDPAGNLARQITRVYDALNRLQTVTGALQ
jgi:YD repeat-containing protein